MDAPQSEEILRVVEASLSYIKWRLRPSSKFRLQIDVLALCSRMRPCVMVDYGGKMPELQDHLCAFLNHCRMEMPIFQLMHVMVIDDMIYLIHKKAFADFVKSSFNVRSPLRFVDLEKDPPKMITEEKNPAVMQLVSAQKLFSSVFNADLIVSDHLQGHGNYPNASHIDGQATYNSFELVDLSYKLRECQVTIPTLNGWLLGYPVIYLFGKDHIEHAICNLSTKSLHIYQVFVDRVDKVGKGSHKEELMSFSVPWELSLEGNDEPWAKSFLDCMQRRLEKCKHIWRCLHMDVTSCYPQAIALYIILLDLCNWHISSNKCYVYGHILLNT